MKLFDAEDVIVETVVSSADGSWKDVQKVKLTFSTDKEFEKMEWEAEYYIKE